jgi:hypothetical protein
MPHPPCGAARLEIRSKIQKYSSIELIWYHPVQRRLKIRKHGKNGTNAVFTVNTRRRHQNTAAGDSGDRLQHQQFIG